MAGSNIVYRSFRLNLDNEQHRRVNKVLAELNMGIHKSVNQFLADAVDFYADSFGDKSLLKKAGGREEKESGYISRNDLEGIREELRNEVKDEMIMLLGAALGGGAGRMTGTGIKGKAAGASGREPENSHAEEAADPTMMELVDDWG